jgi:hypothetical protein
MIILSIFNNVHCKHLVFVVFPPVVLAKQLFANGDHAWMLQKEEHGETIMFCFMIVYYTFTLKILFSICFLFLNAVLKLNWFIWGVQKED